MALTAGERETIIRFDDEGDTAYVTTYNRPLITSLRKNTATEETTGDSTRRFGGAEFRVPKQLISIRRPRSVTSMPKSPRAPMTQEHKDKLAAGRRAAKAAKVNA
jgi:hypothetical protein